MKKFTGLEFVGTFKKVSDTITVRDVWMRLIGGFGLYKWNDDYRLVKFSSWRRTKFVDMPKDEFDKLEKPIFWNLKKVVKGTAIVEQDLRESLWISGAVNKETLTFTAVSQAVTKYKGKLDAQTVFKQLQKGD